MLSTEDLSLHHASLGALQHEGTAASAALQLDDTAASAALQLDDDQLQHYETHGYVAGIRVLDEYQLKALREDLDRLAAEGGHDPRWYEYNSNESKDTSKVLFHALGAWRLSPAFHDLLWEERVTAPAQQLLRGTPRFWHDQLFCKPARHGGVVAWHQDYSYWTRTVPMAHLTCWIALDDATEDNGCLQYIRGSHKWCHPESTCPSVLPITGLAGDMQAISQTLTSSQRDALASPTAIPLKAGYASFHHPLLVHGSFANSSGNCRRATVINFVRDGVSSATDDELLAGVPPVQKGHALGGQFFPLLRNV